MEGWRAKEIRNKDLMAPCGLYCGACGVYLATRDNNEKFKKIMGGLYGTKPNDTVCLGCVQKKPADTLYCLCASCDIRTCVQSKGYYSCHQCDAWPCDMIEKFGFATGKQVMKRAIPAWRENVAELGDEAGSIAWARAECERYHCPDCGSPLFRGAQRCRVCKRDVAGDLDGSL